MNKTQMLAATLLLALWPLGVVAATKLPAEERIMSCDPVVASAAAMEMLSDPDNLTEPSVLFPAAEALFRSGKKDEALFWFYALQLRSRYQLVFQRGDRGQIAVVMIDVIGPAINNYGLSDTRNLLATIDRVLVWDEKAPNALRDQPHTPEQRAQIADVYSGLRDLQRKIQTEGASLEAEAERTAPQIQAWSAMIEAERCAPGKLDPSLVNQEMDKEKPRVVELVRHHPDVIRAAGTIERASVSTMSMTDAWTLPTRYTVRVVGQRTLYAIVDVARPAGEAAQFSLRCTLDHEGIKSDPCAP